MGSGNKAWRAEHPEAFRKYYIAYHKRTKVEVLSHYSPQGKLRCSWRGCKIVDPDMLSLDHINNDGHKDRLSGRNMYVHCRKMGYPSGFQTLCHNHQWKKEITRREAVAAENFKRTQQ